MAAPVTLSDILGYTSIGCWLGAQFPQVLENIRLRSVEGLALPFLLNWLLGDISNLVGCILTHQLPFQTYLATYFCFVDLTLFGQYFYYRKPSKPLAPYLPRRSRTASITTTRRISSERVPGRYRTLSHVAANVAAAAALAAQQEETRRHRSIHDAHRRATSEQLLDEEIVNSEEDIDDQTLARLTESFHSEGGGPSRRKVVSWSRERRGESLTRASAMSPTTRVRSSLQMTTSPIIGGTEEFDFSARGRPTSREDPEETGWVPTSAQRRSSRASRKGASMVFLGVWALFGIGTLARSGHGFLPRNSIRMGRALPGDLMIPQATSVVPTTPDGTAVANAREHVLSWEERDESRSDLPDHPEDHSGDTEYTIGRISAWICTTLYLTSRLPQIWKNFVRKSVEGLSMYLFVFAFLGNLFYVASILSSPKLQFPEAESAAFLRESIPYLLGSGGTLMFDVTIVAQSFIYRPKSQVRGRRATRTANEEEAGLLSADATGAEDPVTPSRRRLPAAPPAGYP